MALTKFNSEEGFSVGAYPAIDVVDRNANVTANSLLATGNVNLGSIGNLTITGGNSGQFLKSDGTGRLEFVDIVLPTPQGPNTSVVYNNDTEFAGDTNFTYNPILGQVNAIAFAGDGSKLSNVTGANVIGVVANANYAAFANVTLNSLAANTTQFVIGNSQPNITNVGNLEQLNVTGNVLAEVLTANSSLLVQGDATIKGNLIVQGNAIYSNVQTVNVKDPMIELGGDPFGGALTANDLINRGLLVHYYDGQPVKGFMGWEANSNHFTFASNISVVDNEVIIHELGNIQAQNFIGNGVGLTDISGGNVTGIVANANFSQYANFANFAGNVTESNQPNITTVGTLTNLAVSGSSHLGDGATANYFVGDAGNLYNIKGPNVVGTVANANHAQYANYSNTAESVILNHQPNITSLGTLTELNVDGNIIATEITVDDNVTAEFFIGDGYQLSNITGANVTGTVANAANANLANYATHVLSSSQPNITTVGSLTNLTVTGNITGSTITGALFVGNGSELSNLNGANVSEVPNANFSTFSEVANFANFSGNVTGAEQPNIVSLGNLIRLTVDGNLVSGNANLGNLATANFYVGNAFYLSHISGPNVVGVVANANYSAWANRANIANLATIANHVVVNAQPNITSVGILKTLTVSNTDQTGNIIADNANLGNLVEANYFAGNGFYLTDLQSDNIVGTVANANYAAYAGLSSQANNATTAGTVTANNQPNITSVGTLTNLVVSGNVTASNANLGNAVVANYFIGNGHYLYDLNGANVSEVPNANFASYSEQANNANLATLATDAINVTGSSQPNITSLGSLENLTVSGETTAGNITSLGDVTAVSFYGNGYNLISINGANVSEVANANYATYSGQANNSNTSVTVTASSQPNITSLGSLDNLQVVGDVIAGNVTGANSVIANYFIGSGQYLTDINGANVESEVANANYATYSGQANNSNTAVTVTSNSQPNITSLGTLSSLNVSGNISASNISVSNNVSAEYFVGNGAFLTGVITGIDDTIANGNSNISVFETSVSLSANGTTDVVIIRDFETNVLGNLNVQYSITSDTVTANLLTGTLTTGSQPNITSVGVLDELTVTGNVTANNFIGNFEGYISGSLKSPGNNTQVLFNQSGNIGGSSKLIFNEASNTLVVNGNVAVSTNLTRDNKNVTTFTTQSMAPTNPKPGDQWYDTDNDIIYQYIYNGLTNAWVDMSSGFINANVEAQPDSLVLRDTNGNLNANSFVGNKIQIQDAIISGNLVLSGNTAFVDVSSTRVIDPIIELGGGANGAELTTNDGKDRGTLLHYHDDINAIDAFMGWKNANSEFIVASNVTIGNNVVTVNELGNIRASYFIGDGSQLSNIPASAISGGIAQVDSNITNVVAGSAIGVSMDYSDPTYPAGKFMIYQLGPVSLTMTDVWESSNTTSKNAYANFLAGSVNTSNIKVTFNLANANFSVQSSDKITIGGSIVTGANLLALGITGNSGTYTIPSDYVAANVQTNATSAVTANLTTTRGQFNATGTNLTTAQPVAYNVNSITGSFPISSVPYWNLNQSFNWSMSVTGTTASGNLTYSGGSVTTTSLTSAGATSGSSGSINSTSSYTITTNDYTGAGLNGYGTRTIPSAVNGTVNAATKYYPLFWKITANSTVPTFTVSDSRNSNNFAINQGANTSTTLNDHLWLAIPNSSNLAPLQSRTFKHVFGGFDIIDTPAATGTQTISANGESYNYSIYGFTGFTSTAFIIVTS